MKRSGGEYIAVILRGKGEGKKREADWHSRGKYYSDLSVRFEAVAQRVCTTSQDKTTPLPILIYLYDLYSTVRST